MAHQRSISGVDGAKEPHTVSLKVLRLSRPSLSIQHPLPTPLPSPLESSGLDSGSKPGFPPVSASYAYPVTSSTINTPFILSPILTLPPAFGSAYVGETFSCTLCANNEIPSSTASLPTGSGSTNAAQLQKSISNVRIEAEMKIPSSGVPVPLVLGPDLYSSPKSDEKPEKGAEKGVDLAPGESLQRIVNFDLKEEGSHVLAVTVTYSETTPTSGRVRTFRKLYQFVCKSCMIVRTKTGSLPSSITTTVGGEKGRKWALEAQLENTGDECITLDTVSLETRGGFRSTGLNWEVDAGLETKPCLMPGDVEQVCFLVEEVERDKGDSTKQEVVDGRLVFGVLKLGWRGQMGNIGSLSTGNLGARLK